MVSREMVRLPGGMHSRYWLQKRLKWSREKWFEYLEEYIIFFLIFEESGHQLIRKIFDLYVDSAPSGLN
jgi:hypothetical protein